MNLRLAKDPQFERDLEIQFEWYEVNARPGVSDRFLSAVFLSLQELLRQPELGRVRRFRNERLRGFRSWIVGDPFDRLLLFYRIEGDLLVVKRLLHGARNLPRRLSETS
jgi:plasmid stabilization system protein ParE